MSASLSRSNRLIAALAAVFALTGAASGQTIAPVSSVIGDTVSWSISVKSGDSVKAGSRVEIALRGDVVDGWHIYSSEQLPSGPIPLKVTLGPSAVATADGVLTSTAPAKTHDPSFDLDTQYYDKPFTVTVPVRVGTAAGPQQIPVSVRFQACNGKTCKPPKTVKLSAPITVRADG